MSSPQFAPALGVIHQKMNDKRNLFKPLADRGPLNRDEHGSELDRTGSGLKPIFGGSGLDRTQKIFVVLM